MIRAATMGPTPYTSVTDVLAVATAAGTSPAIALTQAWFSSSFEGGPDQRTRTRADHVAGTPSTVSPAATSCWANKQPSPPAASIAHVRSSNDAAQARSRSV